MLKNSRGSIFSAITLVLGATFIVGCSSNTRIDDAANDAQRALETAQEARDLAQEALQTANAARQSSDAAQACCAENRDALERAMERMQQK